MLDGGTAEMKTLLTNLKHAARNGEHLKIGGGIFSPADIAKAVKEVEEAVELEKFHLNSNGI
jgi:hypothetical protein